MELCVLYYVCTVHCTMCAQCTALGVHCGLYCAGGTPPREPVLPRDSLDISASTQGEKECSKSSQNWEFRIGKEPLL